MWTDQNRVYAAFMGVIDGYLEVDGEWEQDLIKGCGKRIAESKRLHIRCPTKCVLKSAKEVHCIKPPRFYLIFSKKHNHLKITVAHIHAPITPIYPYKDPSVCAVCHPQRPPCGCVTNHAGNELGASSGNSTSYLSTSAQIWGTHINIVFLDRWINEPP